MRRNGARDVSGWLRRAVLPAVAASSAATAAVLGAALLMPVGHSAERLAGGLGTGLSVLRWQPRSGPPASARGQAFRGTPAVGALFSRSHGRLGEHFCTASVVHSKPGNLLITAAHCLAGRPVGGPDGIVFVPGFHDGKAPDGSWPVTAVFVDRAWSARQDPDDDVAFLRAGPAGGQLETVTGADRLGTGWPPQRVTVIGYPDGAGRR